MLCRSAILQNCLFFSDDRAIQASFPRGGLWEGYHESRRCSRDTYPESYILKYTSIRRKPHALNPKR